MMGLTRHQRQLLAFLRDENTRSGQMPTYEEMRRHIGLASRSGIARLLGGLEERGHIRRIPNRARAIELVDASALARFSTAELKDEIERRARAA